jgi:NitT/TauT family transport system substrate-binding protein
LKSVHSLCEAILGSSLATKPTTLDEATALKNALHIMKRFLEMALYQLPDDSRIGEFIATSWGNSHAAFTTLGSLKGTGKAADAYTPQFLKECNAFDHAAIIAEAKAAFR